MQQINFDPSQLISINKAESFSTDRIILLRSMILKAYDGIKEIDDILINWLSNRVNVIIVIKNSYSNDLLKGLVCRQLIIYDNPESKSYLFSFDYPVKKFYKPNDSEVSIKK